MIEIKEIPHYGKTKPYQGKESDFQKAAIRFIRMRFDKLAYHVPNGGSRNIIEASRLKAEGVLKGVPDIVSDLPSNGFHGLRIELKNKKGIVKAHQYEILKQMQDRGYFVAVCWSLDGLIKVCEKYYK